MLQTEIQIAGQTLTCEVAQTFAEKAQGLQDHDPLDDTQGMLFEFDRNPRGVAFHQGTVDFPLDVIFIDRGTITKIVENTTPGRDDEWKGVATTVLELRGGWCQDYEVFEGDTVTETKTAAGRGQVELNPNEKSGFGSSIDPLRTIVEADDETSNLAKSRAKSNGKPNNGLHDLGVDDNSTVFQPVADSKEAWGNWAPAKRTTKCVDCGAEPSQSHLFGCPKDKKATTCPKCATRTSTFKSGEQWCSTHGRLPKVAENPMCRHCGVHHRKPESCPFVGKGETQPGQDVSRDEHGQQPVAPQPSMFQGLKNLSSKAQSFLQSAPAAVKSFVQDPAYRRAAMVKASETIGNLPSTYGNSLIRTARHEVHEFKLAGQGLASLAQGKPLDPHQKSALKTVGFHMALTTAVVGLHATGIGAGAALFAKAMAKHVAMKAVTKSLSHLHVLQEMGHLGTGISEVLEKLAQGVPQIQQPQVLVQPEQSEDDFARLVMASVSKSLGQLSDEDIQQVLEQTVAQTTQHVPVAPIAPVPVYQAPQRPQGSQQGFSPTTVSGALSIKDSLSGSRLGSDRQGQSDQSLNINTSGPATSHIPPEDRAQTNEIPADTVGVGIQNSPAMNPDQTMGYDVSHEPDELLEGRVTPNSRHSWKVLWPIQAKVTNKVKKMLENFGPPNEWSGAVAAVAGEERRKQMVDAWEEMSESEKKQIQTSFEEKFAGLSERQASLSVRELREELARLGVGHRDHIATSIETRLERMNERLHPTAQMTGTCSVCHKTIPAAECQLYMQETGDNECPNLCDHCASDQAKNEDKPEGLNPLTPWMYMASLKQQVQAVESGYYFFPKRGQGGSGDIHAGDRISVQKKTDGFEEGAEGVCIDTNPGVIKVKLDGEPIPRWAPKDMFSQVKPMSEILKDEEGGGGGGLDALMGGK